MNKNEENKEQSPSRTRRQNGDDLPLSSSSRITPRYTVTSCFGVDRMAAMANVQKLMPHVENTAVVTTKIHRGH